MLHYFPFSLKIMNSLSGASHVASIPSVYQYLLSAYSVQGKELVSTLGIQQCHSQMKSSAFVEFTFLSGEHCEPRSGSVWPSCSHVASL